ncbi:MAG TPA: MFS transporter [Chloroflexota bacterium]|nr:MFS transporter [Chloroflexota bacterium]
MAVVEAQRTHRRVLPSISGPKPILAMVASAHGVTHMYSTLLPLVYPLMQAQFGFSYGELGLIVGISSALGGVLQFGFGLAGRYVPHRMLIGLGNVCCGLTIALFGAVGSFFQFSIVRVLNSVAQAPQHPIGNSMIANRFSERKRGAALSIHVAGGNLGTILVPLVGTFLIAQLGWRATMVIFSLPGLLIGSAIMATVTESKESREVMQEASLKADMGAILRNRTLLLIVVSSMVAAGGRGLGVVLTYVPLYLTNGLHLSTSAVGVLFTVLLAGSIVGPLAGGKVSDMVGRKRAMLIALIGSFAATLALVLSGPVLAGVAAALVGIGLFVYAQGPIMQTYLADVVPAERRDSIFGAYFAITFGAGAVYAAGVGALIDRFGFGAAFITMAVSYVATFLILLPAQEHRLAVR